MGLAHLAWLTKLQSVRPRFNCSFEYAGLVPRYARFLEQEILPEVAKWQHLSGNTNDRVIAGSSSAICIFTAAWERPEVFSGL